MNELESNYITVSQFASALGIQRTAAYHHTKHIRTDEDNGVRCIRRDVALGYIEAQLRQKRDDVARLERARTVVLCADMKEDDDA